MYFGGEETGERGEDNANNHHNNHLLNKVLQTAGSPQQAYFSNWKHILQNIYCYIIAELEDATV